MGGSASSTKRAQVRQLRAEIDRLAVMLFEVKNQAEKIQAAADALGDGALDGKDREPEFDTSSVLVFPESDPRARFSWKRG